MKSDNLILVKDLSATEAARRLSDVLDAVEHRGESFSIVRHGRPVARLNPRREVERACREGDPATPPADAAWADELADLRSRLVPEAGRGASDPAR